MIFQMGSESPLRTTETIPIAGGEEEKEKVDKEKHPPCNLSGPANPAWHYCNSSR